MLTKTFAQTIVFWTIFLFVGPWAILQIESVLGLSTYRFASSTGRIVGLCVFAMAGMIGLVSCYVLAVKGRGTPVPFDCPPRLVIAGPYRYVRNPMAASALAQGFAVGIYLGSPLVLAYVLAGLLVAQLVVSPWEERDLERRFADAYCVYRQNVGRWIPRLTAYPSQVHQKSDA